MKRSYQLNIYQISPWYNLHCMNHRIGIFCSLSRGSCSGRRNHHWNNTTWGITSWLSWRDMKIWNDWLGRRKWRRNEGSSFWKRIWCDITSGCLSLWCRSIPSVRMKWNLEWIYSKLFTLRLSQHTNTLKIEVTLPSKVSYCKGFSSEIEISSNFLIKV